MKQTHQELTQSLLNIKNNIMECIDGFDTSIEAKSSIIDTMRTTMKDIERAKKLICNEKR